MRSPVTPVELQARLINPADDQGYPRWVELPRIKAHYAEVDLGHQTLDDLFWADALQAAQHSVDLWYPDPTDTAYDIPNNSYDRPRRLRHKVLYLYSGPTYIARDPPGLLHPQADLHYVATRRKKNVVQAR